MILRIFGTRVRVKRTVLIDLAALWAGLSWWGMHRHPGRPAPHGLLIGLASGVVLAPADFGHAIAHIFSARYAGAPMDEILISEGMPRTLYWNNAVSPDVHRLRALGGPVFNLLALAVSLCARRLSPGPSIARELADWSALGHGVILIASLAPLPIVDGGTLLKWTLVARGRAESEAEELVRRIDWAIGIPTALIGVGLIAVRRWVAGIISLASGLAVIGIAAGKIR
ncbi:MAG: hypothetical protein ACM3JD_06200 [Rudaea sp.]